MSENGQSLGKARITLTATNQVNGDESAAEYNVKTDLDGNFHFRHLQAGQYELDLSAKHHQAEKVVLTITEGRTESLRIMATPSEPSLKLYASQLVFLPGEQPKLEVHGFAMAQVLTVNLYKLDDEEIASHMGIENTLAPIRQARDNGGKLPKSTLVRTDTFKIENKDAEGEFIEMLKLQGLPDGFYYASCAAGPARDLAFINVTRIAMVTKTSASKTLCYVTDLQNGKPISGARVFSASKRGLKEEGVTDVQGLTTVSRGNLQGVAGTDDADGGGRANGEATLLARSGTSAAICNMYNYGGKAPGKLFVYTERPIYRPGDLVQFKGIARRLQGDDFKLPGSGSAKVTVTDPDGNLIQQMDETVNPHGSFNGSFSTSVEAKPGAYRISCSAFGLARSQWVTLAAYRKPQFKIDITPEKSTHVLGDPIKAVIACNYYYGAPAVGAKVKVDVYRSIHWEFEDDEDGGDDAFDPGYGNYHAAGEYSFQAEAVTDESGKAIIEIPTEAQKKGDDRYSFDFDYSLNVSVADDSGQTFGEQANFTVYQGDYALKLSSADYIIRQGQSFNVDVKLDDHSGDPVAGRTVSVTAERVHWRRKNQFEQVEDRESIGTVTVTTDVDGKARATIPMREGGLVTLTATATDLSRRGIQARTSVYVEGDDGFLGQEPSEQLTLTLDRKAYSVGDKVHLLIQAPSPGGTALLCVQANEILQTKLVPINGQATDVDLSVAAAFAPNAYISVAYVKDKKFMEANRSLKVNWTAKRLNLKVLPGSEKYLPGQRATVKIEASDDRGKPVRADVSLAVVDESIYGLQEDSTDILRSFYPRRPNDVTTSFSFPEIYLDGGDKGGRNIPIRSKFRDTAYWQPAIETDSKGVAVFQFKLPDNITEWRATAVGATDDTAVGMQTANFKAAKPLMLRIDAPTFMVMGDTQRIVVAVTNDGDRDADVNVRLKLTGVTAEGDSSRKVRVAAGKSQNVDWSISASSTGNASLVATAWIDRGASDGVLKTVSIEPRGRLSVESSSGPVSASVKTILTLAPDADRTTGRLAITLSPSLASVMAQSLDSLIAYPYGCVEQTMDRFMPAIRVEGLVRDLNLPKPSNLAKVPDIARDSMARLATMQHADGGWGWWVYDKSDPFMTAFVLDGLKRAEAGGYKSYTIHTHQALQWAINYFEKGPPKKAGGDGWQRPEKLGDKLYLLDSLVKFGHPEEAVKVLPTLDWRGADPTDLSIGVWLYDDLGPGFRARRNDLLAKLKSYAVTDGGATHWLGQGWSSADANTAMAFTAFMRVAPDDPLADGVVRYLMQHRRDNMWDSTFTTGITLEGLDLYMRHLKPQVGKSQVDVLVNGRKIRTYALTPATLFDASYTLRVPVAELKSGANEVEFRQTGSGSSYYFAELKQYGAKTQEVGYQPLKGLSITKSYRVLRATRLEDGSLKLLPSAKPVDSADSGDILQCTLLIHSDLPRQFVMIEDPIPSNCRVTERDSVEDSSEWNWWWCSLVQLDDRVALFARDLNAGDQTIKYTLRAEGSGLSRALPATVVNMYDSGQQASSAEAPLEVRR